MGRCRRERIKSGSQGGGVKRLVAVELTDGDAQDLRSPQEARRGLAPSAFGLSQGTAPEDSNRRQSIHRRLPPGWTSYFPLLPVNRAL